MSTVRPATRSQHPLERLSAEEIDRNRSVLEERGAVGPNSAFALVGLLEPDKAEVLAHLPGEEARRHIKTVLLDTKTGAVQEAVVDVVSDQLIRLRDVDVIAEGQPPILAEEFDLVEQLLRQDPGWSAAMRKRGIQDLELVRISALSAGIFELPGEEGRRIVRCLSFLQHDEDDNAWAHPIDGVVAYLDLISGEVLELIDDGVFPIPDRDYRFHDPDSLPAPRTTQRPLEITQPEGPSFTLDGDVLTWERWQLRVGFDQVEGLVLHQIGFQDGETIRPVIYRASIAEMVVPYGDPSPVRFWQNYFDAGEYSLGKEANSLRLGCDCLGEIRYLDAVIADSNGRSKVIPNAICIHEEDASILWKHTDAYYGSVDVRRNRRLVVSFFITVGNYDYGFYWYFSLDGAIEFECKATGVLFASAYPGPSADGTEYPWASQVAPGIGAPYHQHLFCARLDMTVDGVTNAVDEVEARRVPIGPSNPYGNGFTQVSTRLASELQGVRRANGETGRTWAISNPDKRNAVGKAPAYVLYPEGHPVLLADPASSIARRAAFTTNHLWVTAYSPDQRFPSGDLVNQNAGANGLDSWVRQDRDIDGADIVLWHSFGLTHFPRPEDWPIMPVDHTGFVLKPFGFFDENPTLDVPESHQMHPHEGDHGDHCHS